MPVFRCSKPASGDAWLHILFNRHTKLQVTLIRESKKKGYPLSKHTIHATLLEAVLNDFNLRKEFQSVPQQSVSERYSEMVIPFGTAQAAGAPQRINHFTN